MSARREVVRQLRGLGLSERRALRLVGMSASTLRYEPRDDGNAALRERLKELAGQHRRHGYRMLHSQLQIDGWAINVKRTYRIYREEGLMVRKRRRKKLPVPERQPLVRPIQPNEVWSMDFVFDELANGRRVKKLTVVDDCSNGPEFAGRTMQTWAAKNGVELRFIQPGKPVQNAYIDGQLVRRRRGDGGFEQLVDQRPRDRLRQVAPHRATRHPLEPRGAHRSIRYFAELDSTRSARVE